MKLFNFIVQQVDFVLLAAKLTGYLFFFRTWGIINLTVAFIWQLYTLYLLVQLHESTETGMRYSRYLQLCGATFGKAPLYLTKLNIN